MTTLKAGKYVSWLALVFLIGALSFSSGRLTHYTNYALAKTIGQFGFLIGVLAMVLALMARKGLDMKNLDQRSAYTNVWFFSIVAILGNLAEWLYWWNVIPYLP